MSEYDFELIETINSKCLMDYIFESIHERPQLKALLKDNTNTFKQCVLYENITIKALQGYYRDNCKDGLNISSFNGYVILSQYPHVYEGKEYDYMKDVVMFFCQKDGVYLIDEEKKRVYCANKEYVYYYQYISVLVSNSVLSETQLYKFNETLNLSSKMYEYINFEQLCSMYESYELSLIPTLNDEVKSAISQYVPDDYMLQFIVGELKKGTINDDKQRLSALTALSEDIGKKLRLDGIVGKKEKITSNLKKSYIRYYCEVNNISYE